MSKRNEAGFNLKRLVSFKLWWKIFAWVTTGRDQIQAFADGKEHTAMLWVLVEWVSFLEKPDKFKHRCQYGCGYEAFILTTSPPNCPWVLDANQPNISERNPNSVNRRTWERLPCNWHGYQSTSHSNPQLKISVWLNCQGMRNRMIKNLAQSPVNVKKQTKA